MAIPTSAGVRIAVLNDAHDRNGFTCGVESLDRYLKIQAGQEVRRKANAVFVLSRDAELDRVLGYYTLCAMAISQGQAPEAARKHVPRYPLVSCTLVGRLAIAKGQQGQGLGSVLLVDALQRAFESADTVGSSMVIVDALDEAAAGFYAAHRTKAGHRPPRRPPPPLNGRGARQACSGSPGRDPCPACA